jgi:hypothetical protein
MRSKNISAYLGIKHRFFIEKTTAKIPVIFKFALLKLAALTS